MDLIILSPSSPPLSSSSSYIIWVSNPSFLKPHIYTHSLVTEASKPRSKSGKMPVTILNYSKCVSY